MRVSAFIVYPRVMISRLLAGVLLVCLTPMIFWGTEARATTVDVLLVYDITATAWVGSNGGMAAFSQDAVTRMNQAMQNSNVDLEFRLAHSMSIAYTTTSGPSTPLSGDLTALQGGLGVFSEVHSARDTHGADVVAMFIDHGSAYGYVGVGYILSTWSGMPNYAYTVNAIRSVAQSHTLTHEVGHNLGAHHSKYQTQSPGPNTHLTSPTALYSAGWYFTGSDSKAYHTIMAYNTDGYGNTYYSAPLFSTPLATFQGRAAGHAENGDNARLIRLTKETIAGYRDAVLPSFTLNVNASGVSNISITGNPAIYGGSTNYSETGIPSGSSISLTAPSSVGNAVFDHWEGCSSSSGELCTVSMTSDKTVTAQYTIPPLLTIDPDIRTHTAEAADDQTLAVTATVPWTAETPMEDTWINLTGGNPGSGDGTVLYSVAANTEPWPRSSTITVNGGGITRTLTVNQAQVDISLPQALDNSRLVWTTNDPGIWTGQSAITHDGIDAAQSETIAHNQQAMLQTTVTGPGTVEFWWKVSSETDRDYLWFHIGDSEQANISGLVDWQHQEFVVPEGSHTLSWTYTKDQSVNAGSDRGWVDQVIWKRDTLPMPWLMLLLE